MSMRALLLAVRDRLRASAPGGLAYESAQCEVGFDGMPHPRAGQVFVAVHPGSVSNEADTHLAERYTVYVTLTMRAGHLPQDREGSQLMALASTGLYARAEAIRTLLHMNEAVRSDANTTIGVGDNGFTETIRYQSMDSPQLKGPDWFGAEDPSDGPVGLAIQLTFGGAMRYQVIEEQS